MISYIVAHAAADLSRISSLERLLAILPRDLTYVVRSYRREHASVWANRVYQAAVQRTPHDHVVILNDDVIVPPEFAAVCEAIVKAVPDECISLHASAPAIAAATGPWVRSYHYTGPAVILPPGAAASLLDYSSRMPWSWVSRVNEDELAAQWAWERQRPFWLAVPSPVIHDTSIPSTLGYDGHAERTSSVPWTSDEDLTRPERWAVAPYGDAVPYIECTWNPTARLAQLGRILRHSTLCLMCRAREGIVGKPDAKLCRYCISKCTEIM